MRSKKNPAYGKRWHERSAKFVAPIKSAHLWVHAVSLGESIAATPLIKAYQNAHPDHQILITSTTPTGSAHISKTFGSSVFHVYTPFDLPHIVKRFLQKTKPKKLVIMETELWPNLIFYSQKRNIPILLANARLSEKSARGYKRILWLTKPMLNSLTLIATQTHSDAQRFAELGALKEKIHITGNIKFDINIPEDIIIKSKQLRQEWGTNRPTFIAASTHKDEEEKVLLAFAKIKKAIPQCLLVLVPRHPERFNEVAELCEKHHYQITRYSKNAPAQNNIDIFLGDTMGKLLLFYAASDVAFVGGSLVPTGGHNLLEPAALKIPSVVGPYTFNFSAITQKLINAHATKQVNNCDELADTVIQWLTDTKARQKAGDSGLGVVNKNRGALAKQLELIEKMKT